MAADARFHAERDRPQDPFTGDAVSNYFGGRDDGSTKVLPCSLRAVVCPFEMFRALRD